MKRRINGFLFGMGALLIACSLTACATGQGDGDDPTADVPKYRTQDRRVRTVPWSTPESWEQGGVMGAFQDPRYRR